LRSWPRSQPRAGVQGAGHGAAARSSDPPLLVPWSRIGDLALGCRVKVGRGSASLPATTSQFLKPWFFIYTRRGRVTGFDFALKFVD
jgi:hypothetical protein